METSATIGSMARGLANSQIERVTRELLAISHHVTVRQVMQALRAQFGGCGRTERICRILKHLESVRERPGTSTTAGADELQSLREQLRAAQLRASLSEERERRHQDLWARRYAEKLEDLEKHRPKAAVRAAGISYEQYLRVYQRAAELGRRLARYEDPDKPQAEQPE